MKKSALALVIAGLVSSSGAMASDGVITVTGLIVDKTCTITGTNGKDVVVTLPTVNKIALTNAGQAAGTTQFKITLASCPANVMLKANFDGTNVLTSGLLKNNGLATNVGVQLLNDTQAPINLATQAGATTVTTDTNGDGVLNYYAQYIAIGGSASTGTVTTSVNYSIVYP